MILMKFIMDEVHHGHGLSMGPWVKRIWAMWHGVRDGAMAQA
jgi:hypothetical protein